MKTCLCLLLVFWCASSGGAQEWQSYQLTNFPPAGQVRQCGSVMDTLGHVHHYFIAWMGSSVTNHRTYYLRTDIYGQVLTDTMRLDAFADPQCLPFFTSVVGDGANSWCVFSQRQGLDWRHGLYLSGHGSDGNVIMPTTLLGYPGGGEGPPSWDLSATYRATDQTIHLVGNTLPFFYYRFKVMGPDTQIWHQPIDGVTLGVDPEIHLGPDGVPWAAMRNDLFPGTEILLVRFGEDTSQTVYHPFGQDVPSWYLFDFGIDDNYNFHFMVNSDTADIGYIRLDHNLIVQESRTIDSSFLGYGTMKVDPAGNCLFVWSDEVHGLKWAYRQADGAWPHSPSILASNREGSSFSIIAMDSTRFAFTCQGASMTSSYMQYWMYTFGYPPPNDAAENPRPSQTALISAYPNPFTSSLNLELPTSAQALTIYDLLGRTVWSQQLSSGARRVSIADQSLNQLPSGVYFLKVAGNTEILPQRIIHFK